MNKIIFTLITILMLLTSTYGGSVAINGNDNAQDRAQYLAKIDRNADGTGGIELYDCALGLSSTHPQSWYESKGRCAEVGNNIWYWIDRASVIGTSEAQSEFENQYMNICKSLFDANEEWTFDKCNDRLLCKEGDDYIKLTKWCQVGPPQEIVSNDNNNQGSINEELNCEISKIQLISLNKNGEALIKTNSLNCQNYNVEIELKSNGFFWDESLGVMETQINSENEYTEINFDLALEQKDYFITLPDSNKIKSNLLIPSLNLENTDKIVCDSNTQSDSNIPSIQVNNKIQSNGNTFTIIDIVTSSFNTGSEVIEKKLVQCPENYKTLYQGYWNCPIENGGQCFCVGATEIESLNAKNKPANVLLYGKTSPENKWAYSSVLTSYSRIDIPSRSPSYQPNYLGCAICTLSNADNIDIEREKAKKIFVTSTTYNGNLGGEEGADQKCQERADAAGLYGSYKAWLLDGTNEQYIINKFKESIYMNMKGERVAKSFNKIVSTNFNLENKINYDEYSELVLNPLVWTGLTKAGGIDKENNCLGWTINSGKNKRGLIGNAGTTDNNYFSYSAYECYNNYALICAEI